MVRVRPTSPPTGNLSLDTIATIVPQRSWLVYVALLALLLQWAVSPLLCGEGGSLAIQQPSVDDVVDTSSLSLGASTEPAMNQKQRQSPTPPHSKSATWSDIFPGARFRIGDLSPHQFYQELSSLSSVEIAEKLQDGELKGRHIRSYLSSIRITLEPDEDDVDVSTLAEKYGYDRLNLYNIERAFVGSELYNAIDNAVCAILAEDGTHTMLLGDSTISNMMMRVMDGFACQKQNATISIASKEDTAEKRKTWYVFRRAYADTTAKIDYSVPEGTKRALVITNFEGLHSLSLYPVRPFEEIIANGRRLFEVWDDYIRYEQWQVSRMPVETFLVTANQNAVDSTRMRGEYGRYSKVYQQDPVGYGEKCSAAWNVSAATCRNSVFTNDGVDYLNRWLPKITRVDVDVNALTKGRGYLSKPKDGRHYWNLGRLKVAQFLVVYLLRRIERFFHQGDRGQEQQQQPHSRR